MKVVTAVIAIGLPGIPIGYAANQQPAVTEDQRLTKEDVRTWGLSPEKSPAENARALSRIFSDPDGRSFFIPAGVYRIECVAHFAARSGLSLIGEGAGKSVFKLAGSCERDKPLMSWISKSDVTLSGWTLDLSNSRYRSRQDVLQFHAYDGDTANLTVRKIAIVNGNTNSLQIAVAATGGYTYSGVVIDGNDLHMTPGRSQNQCIALTTVNGTGKIPSAKITANRCVGSGIQADGNGAYVATNTVSGYQFGTGIFLAFNFGKRVRSATWRDGVVTLIHDHAPNALPVVRPSTSLGSHQLATTAAS